MNSFIRGQPGASALLLLLFLVNSADGQGFDDDCFDQFRKGKEDFVLDVDESVKDGATFLSSPRLDRYRDCVASCCKDSRCNVAFMERAAEAGMVSSCFLFDCLYKKKYVCRFVPKKGYDSYIIHSVYESHLAEDERPNQADRPPEADGGPDRVVQPKDSVTLSGFKSKDDIDIASYHWQMLTAYPYAVIEKTSFDDQIIVSNLTSGIYKFQLTVTDGVGQSDSTKVTVMVLTPEQSNHHCMAPMKAGPCRGSFPRWHYNAASQKCEEFIFGGCKENLNNYLSKDECMNACSGTEKDDGKSGRGLPIPTQQGERCNTPCTAEEFSCDNGCCLDPGLECDKNPQCSDGSDELKCSDYDQKFRILMQIPVDEKKVRCTELPDTGNCRDSQTKWYYNPVQRKCSRFNYGGCKGNDNRFNTEQACERVCSGVTEKDLFARKEEFDRRESDSQTGTIVIAALLGLAILILLGILLYCLMRGKKSSQHHRVPVNNAPLTSLEDRERLVYNSTTKPI